VLNANAEVIDKIPTKEQKSKRHNLVEDMFLSFLTGFIPSLIIESDNFMHSFPFGQTKSQILSRDLNSAFTLTFG
jgi:hypothetical protein